MQELFKVSPTSKDPGTGKGFANKKGTILYVDDEEHNLRVFKSSFRRYFNVITVTNPLEAIEVLKNEDVHLLITDQKMPEMKGTQLIEFIRPEHPNLISIIITGFSDVADISDAINKCGIYKYITKPWDSGELKMTLEQAIEVYDLRVEREALISQLQDANTTLEEKVQERTVNLQELNTKFTDSVKYAHNIQKSILPKKDYFENTFQDYFILYEPLEIIGGDFFFFERVNGKSVLAAFDCTGHGVPGALLSVIGNSVLENLVLDKQITDPALILEQLNLRVFEQLRQTDEDIVTDGMEGVVIVMDEQKDSLSIAGAKGDFVYVENDELKISKGTRLAIGSSLKMKKKEYQKEELTLSTLQAGYLFSDGFRDQLSPADKRIGYKRFLELLDNSKGQPMEAQKTTLWQEFKNWQGDQHQTDDLMVIGIQFMKTQIPLT